MQWKVKGTYGGAYKCTKYMFKLPDKKNKPSKLLQIVFKYWIAFILKF